MTQHHYLSVGKHKIFYRESGDPSAPTILLLHGFPTSSFMYRRLLDGLGDRFHLIAPDLPGFGFTQSPPRETFNYSFSSLTDVVEDFVTALGLDEFALMIFDYGAPVGLRLALRRPGSITAIISQNGNAYEEGLSENWNPIQKYWRDPTPENREALRGFLTPESTQWQYTHGVADPSLIEPEAYTLDSALLARPGNVDIQLDLFLDYAGNVALYPKFQALLRSHRIPVLAVWGKNDPFFVPAGAEAFKRDVPEAEVRFFDTGHFALETHAVEIAAAIRKFLVPARLRAVAS
jgi:pimeloyl-ACP methyl ester carboxylesterase